VTDFTAAQSVFSTGAQFGSASCMPQASMPGREFGDQCVTPTCCEGTNCGAGLHPFSAPSAWPANESATPATLGCTATNLPGTIDYGPTEASATCGDFAGLGGDGTRSFFELDPTHEYLFAFVVDQTGTWAYRWSSTDETSAAQVWPGLRKYGADEKLSALRPAVRPMHLGGPCNTTAGVCAIFHPGASDDRACLMAGADVDASHALGGGPAWATINGQNWWNLFDDTGQDQSYGYEVVPKRK